MPGKLKFKFFIRNLAKGLLSLAIVVLSIIFIDRNVQEENYQWLLDLSAAVVYLVFLISEIVFGIIPPEFFMAWSVKHGLFETYALDVFSLSIISFGAGVLGYFIGAKFIYAAWLTNFKEKYLKKYEEQLMKYGGFLIFVAAMTPLPFSAICMLVGAYQYHFYKFLRYAIFRFLRFALYAYIIWGALKV